MLTIDGSRGEGGGQVLRTSLSLSALTGQPFRLENIRANRQTPGLRPQHLTCVRAVSAICQATVAGDHLDSTTLTFRPTSPPIGGTYFFDVADVTTGGSAGAATLVLQALLWPLLFAEQASQVTIRGGTFVPFSPPFHYVRHVQQPAFARFGIDLQLTLGAWGWYPAGGGQVAAAISPVERLVGVDFKPVPVRRADGVAAVTNLPAHIPQRMAGRAENLLRERRIPASIAPLRERGRGAGAGIVLWVEQGGFSALGRKGVPAQDVAGAAVAELTTFIDNHVAVDHHLADQLLMPMGLAGGSSQFTTNRLTLHTLTNASLLQQWLDIAVVIEGALDTPGTVTIQGCGFSPGPASR